MLSAACKLVSINSTPRAKHFLTTSSALVFLITLSFTSTPASCFNPPMLNIFNRAFTALEGKVASWKVNADLDTEAVKYVVGPDSDYSNGDKFDHSAWDNALQQHVVPGSVDGITTNLVDYKAFASSADLENYCDQLASADIQSMQDVPNELLALYINAYNALCINHVVRFMKENDGALPKSVTETSPVKGTEIWDIEAGVIGGETVSLNDIEHKILRSRWNEPRVHASIVCASASCPNLRTEAFVASKLNKQMDEQTQAWVRDETKGIKIVVSKEDRVEQTFSRIFLWFKGDFDSSGGPVSFAKKFLSNDAGQQLSDKGRDIKYFTYNWNLNTK